MSTSTLSLWAPARHGLRASLLSLLTATALALPARADAPGADTLAALQLNESGATLYSAGNFAGALDRFERAYSLVSEPNLLFNIAGSHERLGQKSQAVEYYRWFLGSGSTNTDGRRRAIAALARLSDAPPPAPEAGWDNPVWPIATLGAGILFAGLGAALYLDGVHDRDEAAGASAGAGAPTSDARELGDAGDTKKLIGGAAFGFGTALIATHVAITLWRSTSHDEPRDLRRDVARAELRLLPGGGALVGSF